MNKKAEIFYPILKNSLVRDLFKNEHYFFLDAKFDLFWETNRATTKTDNKDNIISDLDIPKFLRNYKK